MISKLLQSYKNGLIKKTVSLSICTSIGQGTQSSLMSFTDNRPFHRHQTVIDLVYNQTPLLQKASSDGAIFIMGCQCLFGSSPFFLGGQEYQLTTATAHASQSYIMNSPTIQNFQQNQKGYFKL